MANFFYSFYQLIQRQKNVFRIVLMLLFGDLIWTASTIRFGEDISKLIPSNSENEHLQKVLKTAQFADKIIVTIEKEKEGTTEDLTEYATEFLNLLSENSDAFVIDIQGKVEAETIFETMDFVYNNVPLFLKDADYHNISNNLTYRIIIKQPKSAFLTMRHLR